MDHLEEIIKGCQNGKRKSQQELYQMFAPKMLGVCIRYSNNRAEAEDHLQDGFIKVFDKIRQFAFQGVFEGWLRRVMVNNILEQYRKTSKLHLVDDFSHIEEEEFEEEAATAEIPVAQLIEMINELPPRYRMVFNLYVLEGMNHKEISTHMKISEGTSKSNLARARKILQKMVKEKINESTLVSKYA